MRCCVCCGGHYFGAWSAALQTLPGGFQCLSCFLTGPTSGADLLERDKPLILARQTTFRAVCPVVNLDRPLTTGRKPGQGGQR